MFQLLLVALGGAVGALLRFMLGNILKIYFLHSFYATLCINVIGSFLIGYLISLGLVRSLSEDFIKYFLIIGVLGSFTTFSAFSYEAIELFSSNKIFLFILYVTLSIILCIVSSFVGIYLNKNWLN